MRIGPTGSSALGTIMPPLCTVRQLKGKPWALRIRKSANYWQSFQSTDNIEILSFRVHVKLPYRIVPYRIVTAVFIADFKQTCMRRISLQISTCTIRTWREGLRRLYPVILWRPPPAYLRSGPKEITYPLGLVHCCVYDTTTQESLTWTEKLTVWSARSSTHNQKQK